MSGALRLRNEGSEQARTTPAKDGVSAWLDVLEPMLRMPAAQKRELRDELESHLRDRVNDLIVAGKDEASAVSAAIAELGDAAELAARYARAERGFFGRHVMHMLIGLAAGSAVLLGSLAVRSTTPPAPGESASFIASTPADPAELAALRLNVTHDTTWEAFFADVGSRAKMPVVVSWHRLIALTDNGNFTPGDPVGRSFDQLNLPEALAFLNDSLNQGREDGIAYRVREGRLFISSVEDFDEQEATLTTFSLTPLVESVRQSGLDPMSARQYVEERVMQLVMGLVAPDLWDQAGGTRARCRVFEGKLFVHAPARLQERIRWVLSEAESAAASHAKAVGAEAMGGGAAGGMGGGGAGGAAGGVRGGAGGGGGGGAAGMAAPALGAGGFTRAYPIAHREPKALMETLVRVTEGGVFPFPYLHLDQATGRVMAHGTVAEHERLAAALSRFDRADGDPAALAELETTRRMFAELVAHRQSIEESLTTSPPGNGEQAGNRLGMIRGLRAQEAETAARLEFLEQLERAASEPSARKD